MLEEKEIINKLITYYKNEELNLINYIIMILINKNDTNKIKEKTINKLKNLKELSELKPLLESVLNQLNIFYLKDLISQENKTTALVIQNELEKISKDPRFFNFIKLYKKNTYFDELFKNNLFECNHILNIESLIYNENINPKKTYHQHIKSNYLLLINNKKNLNKYINDKEFLIWTYNYIKKRDYIFSSKLINQKEYKEHITYYFDNIFFKNSLQYEKEIEMLKKAWQQKQFRDQGKIKKKYHLPLTKQAKNELSHLACFKNMSENLILEELIHKAYRDEICDKNGKARY